MAIQMLNQGTADGDSLLPFYDTINGQDRRASLAEFSAVIASVLQSSGMSLVLSTEGIPADSVGLDGQIAVDGAAGVLYLKSGGSWSAYAGGGGTPAPVFTSQPSITGTSQVGQVLTAVDGAASNTTTLTRQWYMDGVAVSGQTGPTYSPVTGDVGKVPGLRNFATGPGGGPVQSSLATASAVIAAGGGVTVPGAPTSVVATAGDGQASVAFVAPTSDGGASITGYRVTASTGQTAAGSASPIVVTGLTNGVAVTFTVAALNSVGYGAESSASNEVTPTAAPTATTYGDTNTIVATSAQRVRTGGGRIVSLTNNGGTAVTVTLYDHHTNSGRVMYTGSVAAGATVTPNARTVFGGYFHTSAGSPNFTIVTDEA